MVMAAAGTIQVSFLPLWTRIWAVTYGGGDDESRGLHWGVAADRNYGREARRLALNGPGRIDSSSDGGRRRRRGGSGAYHAISVFSGLFKLTVCNLRKEKRAPSLLKWQLAQLLRSWPGTVTQRVHGPWFRAQ